MSETKEVIPLILPETAATRKYPFTRKTLDQIKQLRAQQEAGLLKETGKEYMVPAPLIIEAAVDRYHAEFYLPQETK